MMSFTNGQGMTSDILSRIVPRDAQEQLLMDIAYRGFVCMERLYSIPAGGCSAVDQYRPHFHSAAYDCKVEMEQLAAAYMDANGGILEFMKRRPTASIFDDPRVE